MGSLFIRRAQPCRWARLFIFFASGGLVQSLFAFNTRQPFDIAGDSIEYIDESQVMMIEGHAQVIQDSSTLSADFLQYDRLKRRLLARGNVVLREKGEVLLGDQMDYDLELEKGIVLGGKGIGSPWFFQGASWEKEKDHYLGSHASFTSCELVDPHYHVRSSRVHVIPDRLFWAWNNRLYVDKYPVFYTPFLYKSLGKRRVVFQVSPGHDSVKGTFAKTTTTLRFTDRIYDRVLLDHYTTSGTGYGNELHYDAPNRYKGSIFGYFIDPKGSPELVGAPKAPQYNMRFYHWQKLNPYLTFQSNTNLRKNVSFNNQFFAQDYNQSVNDLTSSIALTHQKGKINQRLVLERLDAPDANADPLFGETHIQSASLPRYEFTLYQTPLWSPKAAETAPSISSGTLAFPKPRIFGPLLFSMNGSAREDYERADDLTRSKANTAFTLSESMSFGRNWSLNPTLTPSVNWQDKKDPNGAFKGTQGRMGTGTTLRYRPMSALTLDQTYSWVARMEPNGTQLDRIQADGGIETHRLGWLLFWRPSRSTLMRSFSGYDFRTIADEPLSAYRQRRIDPWTAELTLQPPRSSWDYFFRHQLGYYPTRTLQWEASIRGRLPYKTILETGLLYNRGQSGVLTWNNKVGFYLSPGWRVDAVLNALMPNQKLGSIRDGNFIQSEFSVVRDLHCWEMQFNYRNRPPFTREYSFMINLKLGARAIKEIQNQDLESQFYPWRAN